MLFLKNLYWCQWWERKTFNKHQNNEHLMNTGWILQPGRVHFFNIDWWASIEEWFCRCSSGIMSGTCWIPFHILPLTSLLWTWSAKLEKFAWSFWPGKGQAYSFHTKHHVFFMWKCLILWHKFRLYRRSSLTTVKTRQARN